MHPNKMNIIYMYMERDMSLYWVEYVFLAHGFKIMIPRGTCLIKRDT